MNRHCFSGKLFCLAVGLPIVGHALVAVVVLSFWYVGLCISCCIGLCITLLNCVSLVFIVLSCLLIVSNAEYWLLISQLFCIMDLILIVLQWESCNLSSVYQHYCYTNSICNAFLFIVELPLLVCLCSVRAVLIHLPVLSLQTHPVTHTHLQKQLVLCCWLKP